MRVEETGDFNHQSTGSKNQQKNISEQSIAVIVHNNQTTVNHRPRRRLIQSSPTRSLNNNILLNQRIRAQPRDNQPRCPAPAWPFSPPRPHRLRSPERPLSLSQNANTSASSAQGPSAGASTAADMSDRVSGANLSPSSAHTQFIVLLYSPLLTPRRNSLLPMCDPATPLHTRIRAHVFLG